MSPHSPRGRRPAARLVFLSLVIGAALAAAPSRAADQPHYGRLPVLDRDWQHLSVRPDGTDPVAAEQRRQAVVTRRWQQVHDLVGGAHVSHWAWDQLSRRGLGPALLAAGPDKAEPSSLTDTLRVLIVRISFAANRDPGLTTIPADGDFMLTPDAVPAPIPIDPPPHDKAYFEAHLRGLSEFYRYQSGGRLHIQGRVLPDDPVGSYQVGDIADYGPGADGFWTLEGLESLVRAMMQSADAGTPADGVDLADYGDGHPFTYVIFVHAGSDWQSDINGDSPNDIPTFFITLGEAQPLANGSLTECSVIPETTSQDGFEGSIAAGLYHEFGHALGLPDVYSTETGLPSVGIWDLMDSGTNLPVTLGRVVAPGDTVVTVATGVLPPSISAWNKWFLGWLTMGEVDNGANDVYLPAVGVPRSEYPVYRETNPNFVADAEHPQAVRGGVSPREWFLMENRWVPPDVSTTPFDTLKFERDENTGVIMYLAGYRDGTWQNSGLYDYFLPLGGVLCWHVNMDRIEAGLPDNVINTDGDGLRLVEADGIQDIGVLDAYVSGWYGSYRDPFSDVTEQANLYAEGHPNSRCFDRSWSGLTLSDVRMFGGTGGVMRFGARIEGMAKGFPWETTPVDSAEAAAGGGAPGARGIDPASLTALTIGGQPTVVFADAPPAGWTGGTWAPGLNSLRNNAGSSVGGAPAGRPATEFARLTAPLAGPPQGWTLGDGTARLLAGSTDGQVVFYSFAAANGWPTQEWTADLGDSLAAAPLAAGPGAATCTALLRPGSVATVDLLDGSATTRVIDGETGWRGAPRLVQAADGERLVAFGAGSWRSLVPAGSSATGEYAAAYPRAPQGAVHTVAVGDWSALYDDLGLVGAWDRTGSPVDAADPGAPLVTEPAVADLDGDGRQDVLLATAARVFATRPDGTTLTGFPVQLREMFPLADSTRIATPLVVADADGDGVDEIWFGTNAGHLLSLTARGELRPRFPFRWGDRAGSGFAVAAEEAAGAGRMLWLASAGGYGGQDRDHVLTGGRLTGLRLATPAAADGRTSEWLAAGGGAGRVGPAGAARDLGGLAPAAAEAGRVVLYPNPLRDGDVTVRFVGPVDGTGRVTLYDLEGETVVDRRFPVDGGVINEYVVPVPGIASGMYLCRLQWPVQGGGSETRTLTLAVER